MRKGGKETETSGNVKHSKLEANANSEIGK